MSVFNNLFIAIHPEPASVTKWEKIVCATFEEKFDHIGLFVVLERKLSHFWCSLSSLACFLNCPSHMYICTCPYMHCFIHSYRLVHILQARD